MDGLVVIFQNQWRFGGKQKNMIDIMINVVSSIKRKEDFESKFKEIIPSFIEYHVSNPDKQQLIFEFVARLITKMVKIYEKNNEKKREMVELVLGYSNGASSQLVSEAFQNLAAFKGQVSSSGWQCIQHVLQIFAKSSLYSIKIYSKLMENGLLEIITKLLVLIGSRESSDKQLEFFALELVALMNSIFTISSKPEPIILAVASKLGISIESSEQTVHAEKLNILLTKYDAQCKPLFQTILSSIRTIAEKNKDAIYKYICLYTFEKVISILSIGKKPLLEFVNGQVLGGTFLVYLQTQDPMVTTLILVALEYFVNYLVTPETIHAFFREGVFEALRKIGTNEWKEQVEAVLPSECSFFTASGLPRDNLEKRMRAYPFSDANSSINSLPNQSKGRGGFMREESFLSMNEGNLDQKMVDLLEAFRAHEPSNIDSDSEDSLEDVANELEIVDAPESVKIETESNSQPVVERIQKLAKEIEVSMSNIASNMNLDKIMEKEEQVLEGIAQLLKNGSVEGLDALGKFVRENKGLSITQIKASRLIESIVELLRSPDETKNMRNFQEIISLMISKVIESEDGTHSLTLWGLLVEKMVEHINEEPFLNFSLQKDSTGWALGGKDSILKEICSVSRPTVCQFVFKKKEDIKKAEMNFLKGLESKGTIVSAQKVECFFQIAEELFQIKRNLFTKVRNFPLQVEKYGTFKAIEKFILKEIQTPDGLFGIGLSMKKQSNCEVKFPDGLLYNRDEDSTDFFIEKYERENQVSARKSEKSSMLPGEEGLMEEEEDDDDDDSGPETMSMMMEERMLIEEEGNPHSGKTVSPKSQKLPGTRAKGESVSRMAPSSQKSPAKKRKEKTSLMEAEEETSQKSRLRKKKESPGVVPKESKMSWKPFLFKPIGGVIEMGKKNEKMMFPGPSFSQRNHGSLLGPTAKRVHSSYGLEPSTRDIKASHYLAINFYFEGKLVNPETTLMELVPSYKLGRSFMERNQVFEFDFTLRTSEKVVRHLKETSQFDAKDKEQQDTQIIDKEKVFSMVFQQKNTAAMDWIASLTKIDAFTKAAMSLLAIINNFTETVKQPLKGQQGWGIPIPAKMVNNLRAILNVVHIITISLIYYSFRGLETNEHRHEKATRRPHEHREALQECSAI